MLMVLRAQINTLQEWKTKRQPKWLSSKKSIKPLSTKVEKNCVLIAGNIGHTKVDKENARLLENSVRDVAKETILQSVVKTNKNLN